MSQAASLIVPHLPATAAAVSPVSVATTSIGSLLQISLSLALVLLLIFGIAWFARRYMPVAARRGSAIKIVGGVSVGSRERVLLLEIGEQWLVVGVAPGQVNLITALAREAETGVAEPEAPGFAAALADQLQNWRKN